MNPRPINSTNIVQFGFKTTFDLENAKLIFDISGLTIFQPGGQNNTQGINFEVVDPSGAYLSTIDYPNMDINPALGQTTFEVSLSNSPSQFGNYTIRGVIREANGQDYFIVLEPKNICKPGADFKQGRMPGKFSHDVDCSVPKLTINENTNLTYQTKAPETVTKNGKLYYPQGTLPELSFNYTPFEIFGSGKIYTGDYTVRNKTVASYNMGDLVYVLVTYASSYQFSVNCTSNLCEIMCCIEQMQATIALDCNSPQSQDAKAKLDQVTIPLLMALTNEKCGQDSSELVDQIATTLGCNCNCDDAELVEPRPIYTTFDPVVLQGQCATTAVLEAGVWKVKTKNVVVQPAPGSSNALTVSVEENDCSIIYRIYLNEDTLIRNQLQLIKNSPELTSIFNSLVNPAAIDFSPLGQNCIVDVTRCDYVLTEDASNAAKQVINITLDGQVYPAPAGLSITNAVGIQNWLNALNKGVFTVFYDTTTNPDTTVLRSLNTAVKISTMVFSTNNIQEVRQFSKNCGQLVDILKSIIQYLCGITSSQVQLGQAFAICYLDNQGVKQTEEVGPADGVTLSTLLATILSRWCQTLTQLLAKTTVNCANIQAVFTDAATVVTPADVLYGTRGKTANAAGNCGVWTSTTLANWLLDFLINTNDQTIVDKFCQVKNRCGVAVCNPVTYAEVELIEPCPAISNISGSFEIA